MDKRPLYALPVVSLLVWSGATWAQNAPATPPTTPATTSEDPNEIVCRPGEPAIGSRLPGPRVCHTRKEWKDIQFQSQQQLWQMQKNRSCNQVGNGCGG